MNIRTLTKYGQEQAEELSSSFIKGKLTKEEYRGELILLAQKGQIEITE